MLGIKRKAPQISADKDESIAESKRMDFKKPSIALDYASSSEED